jgi:ACS family glucarate transporter-like MFS transporter
MAGSPRIPVRNQLVLWLFLLSAIAFLDRTNISIAGASMRDELGIDNIQLGWVFSSFLLGYAAFQVLGGWLACRFGPRRVLAAGVVWWGVFSALTTLANPRLAYPLALLIVIRFSLGAGEAVMYPASNQFVAHWIPPAERGRANGWIFAGVGAGAGLSIPILTWLISHLGWRASFWFSATAGTVVGGAWYLLARDLPEQHPRVSREELATIQAGCSPPQTGGPAPALSWRTSLLNRNVVALTASYFAFGYVAWIFFSWFFIYLSQARGFDLKANAFFSMIPFLAMTVCCLAGGEVSDVLSRRYGRRRGRCGIAAAAFLLTAVFLVVGAQVRGPYTASLILAGGAGALYLSQSSFWAVSADLAGERSGVVSGVMNMGCQVGGAVTASLTPYLAARFGWVVAFVFAAVLAVAGGVLWLFVDPSAVETLAPRPPIYDACMTAHEAKRGSAWIVQFALKPTAIAFCFVLVALLWTFPLQRIIAYPFVFLFFAAIMGSAWFGGIIAGMIAVGLSTIVVTYFFVPPVYSMTVAKESQTFLAAFFVCAIGITVVSSARKRIEAAIRDARDQLEVKVQERTAELRRSNLDIQEREQQLRTLTEAIPQQIWRANAMGHIEYCNQHLRSYLGDALDTSPEGSFFKTLHPEDEPLFRQGWEAALVAGGRFEVEARVRGADGVYRWFLVRSFPQRTQDGKIASWYGIHIDIEEQHRAQQSLLLAQDDLTRLSNTLKMAEMTASIAHELNQPLTAVVTHAYACREWLRSDPANLLKASATAEKIVQESTRASAVVKRVRALFSKEAQVREASDMNRLIQDLARLLRDDAIRRGVSIQLVLARDLPLPAIDSVQIQQVLLNLATNAMDAMMQVIGARELNIRSEKRSNEEILVSVEDRGPGIAPEIAERIFEPFFSTKTKGTGMGLAICRTIIEAHDGHLWTEKAPHGGAIFHFTVRTRS